MKLQLITGLAGPYDNTYALKYERTRQHSHLKPGLVVDRSLPQPSDTGRRHRPSCQQQALHHRSCHPNHKFQWSRSGSHPQDSRQDQNLHISHFPTHHLTCTGTSRRHMRAQSGSWNRRECRNLCFGVFLARSSSVVQCLMDAGCE